MKVIVIIILLLIVFSLFSAVFYLIKGDSRDKLVRALMWRVGLSIFLIFLLYLGYSMGIFIPNQPNF